MGYCWRSRGGSSAGDIPGVDARRETLTKLTFNAQGNNYPLWTPDGHHLVFSGSATSTLFLDPSDGGGEPRKLLVANTLQCHNSFSPDGRRLAYDQLTPDSGSDLYYPAVDIERSRES